MIKLNGRQVRRGGLTLIEVLAVLTILVVIGSLVVVNVVRAQRNAYQKAAKTQIQAFKVPLQAYQLDVNEFPSTAEGLEALRTAPSGLSGSKKWSGPYLVEGVPDDPWDRPYRYEYPSRHGSDLPDIWSLGDDGVDGTEDDVVSWAQE